MTTIEIYPEVPKPDWVKVGALCMCHGEGLEVYKIAYVGDRLVALETQGGRSHGAESFTKLVKVTRCEVCESTIGMEEGYNKCYCNSW